MTDKRLLTAPARVLFDAADVLEREGWCQGSVGFSGTPKCVLGAIMVAASDPTYHAAVRVLQGAVGHLLSWNDAPGRTKQEVVAKLREAGIAACGEANRFAP